MHKNSKLLPYQRREVYRRWCQGDQVTDLARQYRVTRKTLYEVFKKAKMGVFGNYSSKNLRYRTLEFGLKRLSKVERAIMKKLGKRERRLNRYQKEYLYVFVDDHCRWLFADILPDQTSWSAAICLDEALIMMPFTVDCMYSDNGKEFKGAFKALCKRKTIFQKFTRPYTPQTNGKAERVIKTIKTELLKGHSHLSREERRRHLYAFVRQL